MNLPETDDNLQGETLEGPEAYAAAGLQPAAAATPPAESATLVAS